MTTNGHLHPCSLFYFIFLNRLICCTFETYLQILNILIAIKRLLVYLIFFLISIISQKCLLIINFSGKKVVCHYSDQFKYKFTK